MLLFASIEPWDHSGPSWNLLAAGVVGRELLGLVVAGPGPVVVLVARVDGVGVEVGVADGTAGGGAAAGSDGIPPMAATARPPVASVAAAMTPAIASRGHDLAMEGVRCRAAGSAVPRSTRARILARLG